MNYVFYKGQLERTYDPRDVIKHRPSLPQFSWVFNSEQRWWYYMERPTSSAYVSEATVPAEYRAMALILNA